MITDDNFEKVPHTNLAIRHSLLATATLKWLTLSRVPNKVAWCLQHVCTSSTAPAISDAPTVETCARLSWKRGDVNVTWNQVAEGDWELEDNVKVCMKSGQTP